MNEQKPALKRIIVDEVHLMNKGKDGRRSGETKQRSFHNAYITRFISKFINRKSSHHHNITVMISYLNYIHPNIVGDFGWNRHKLLLV